MAARAVVVALPSSSGRPNAVADSMDSCLRELASRVSEFDALLARLDQADDVRLAALLFGFPECPRCVFSCRLLSLIRSSDCETPCTWVVCLLFSFEIGHSPSTHCC